MEPNTETPRKVGRPTIYKEPMSRVTITLPHSLINYLKLIGNGNLSRGARALAQDRMTDDAVRAIAAILGPEQK